MAENKDWLTPVAVIGGGIAMGIGAYMVFSKKAEKEPSFSIGKIAAAPVKAPPGPVSVYVPVLSFFDTPVNITVKIKIWNGGGAHELLWEDSKVVAANPGNNMVVFFYQSTLTDNPGRDVAAAVFYKGSKEVESDKQVDVFRVEGEYPQLEGDFGYLAFQDWTSPMIVGGTYDVVVSFIYTGPAASATCMVALAKGGEFYATSTQGVNLVNSPDPGSSVTVKVKISIPTSLEIGMYGLYFEIQQDGNTRRNLLIPNLVSVVSVLSDFGYLAFSDWNSPVSRGGECNVVATFRYKGPATVVTCLLALVKDGVFRAQAVTPAFSVSASTDWGPTIFVPWTIPVPSSIPTGLYGIYFEIQENGQARRNLLINNLVAIV